MLTTWTDGVFEIEVDVEGRIEIEIEGDVAFHIEIEVNVEGRIEIEGREWEVGAAPYANLKKTLNRLEERSCYLVIREAGNTTDYFFLAHCEKDSRTQEIFFRPWPGYAGKELSPLSCWNTSMPCALSLKASCRILWFNAEATETTIPQDAEWRLTLLSGGQGGWMRAQIPLLKPNPCFRFKRESDAPLLETASMEDWVRWVKTALENESDCRFALEFAGMSDEQRWQLVLTWKRGDLGEFKRVCELIAHSVLEWDIDTYGTDFDLTIRPANPEEGLDIGINDYPLEPEFPDFELVQKLYAWAHQLCIAPFDESLYRHTCIRDWLQESEQQVRFPIVPPSMHERMENLKLLVEWAEAEGIDGELKEILKSPRDT